MKHRHTTYYIIKLILFLFLLQFQPDPSGLAARSLQPTPIQGNIEYNWKQPQDPKHWFLIKNDTAMYAWSKMKFPGDIPEPKKNNKIWQRLILPNIKQWRNPILYIESVDQIFRLHFEKKVLYEFGKFQKPYADPGYRFHIIPLPKNFSNKQITFEIYSNHKTIGIRGPIRLGSPEKIIENVIHEDLNAFIAGILFIFLALSALPFL